MDSLGSCPSAATWRQLLESEASSSVFDECNQHLESCSNCRILIEQLTDGNRDWSDIAAELRQPASALPPAYWRALDQLHVGFAHSQDLSSDGCESRSTMKACIHVERMMHRNSIAVTGDSAAAYALVKLIPSGAEAGKRALILNLALALDVSGSMYEEDGTGISRLQRVQDAALAAIQKLHREDTLTIVGFAQNARVFLPPTPLAEKNKIEEVLRNIDSFDVDPGGTAMDEGLALALTQVEMNTRADKLSQVVVLTDGETSGEHNCRMLAQQTAARKIHLTLMGVGLDWKASLLKELASLGQGKWYYIDVQQAEETMRIFAEEFETLVATAFLDVQLQLQPIKDVNIKRVRQVVPEIKELALEDHQEQGRLARLGTLQHDSSARYIIDLSLPKRPDGKYVIAQFQLTFDPGTGQRESSGPIPLEMTYSAAGPGYGNAEVMKHIDEVQLKEMSDVLHQMLQRDDRQAAAQLAQEIVKKGELIGPRALKKTQLVRNVLEELHAKGRVTKQTQLALEDAARLAEMD